MHVSVTTNRSCRLLRRGAVARLHSRLAVATGLLAGHSAGRHARGSAILTRVRIVAAGLRSAEALLGLLRLAVLRLLRLAILRLLRLLAVLARVRIVAGLTTVTRLLRLTGLTVRAARHELRLPEVGLLSRTRGKSVAAGGLIHGDNPTLGWLCCAKNLPYQADARSSDEGTIDRGEEGPKDQPGPRTLRDCDPSEKRMLASI